MFDWIAYAFVSVGLVLAGTALFFFSVTRGALLLRGAIGGVPEDVAHIYPIYSNRQLIRLVDFQPVSSAILLFQYERLVSSITQGLGRMDLRDKNVLITSCAFGNVIPRVVRTAVGAGARRVLIADIIKHELDNAQGKLAASPGKVEYLEENATAMRQADGSVIANVIFFLLHELPHHDQVAALREAARLLAPGGKLFLAEFHRPTPWLLRAMGWTYFKTFEPWALAVWDKHDPLRQLEEMGGFTSERRTLLFGYFQLVVATKNAVG